MSDMHNDMGDDQLKSKLGGYEERPSDDLWGKIASGATERGMSEQLRTFEEEPDQQVWLSIAAEMKRGVVVHRIDRVGQIAAVIALLLLLIPGVSSFKPGNPSDVKLETAQSISLQRTSPVVDSSHMEPQTLSLEENGPPVASEDDGLSLIGEAVTKSTESTKQSQKTERLSDAKNLIQSTKPTSNFLTMNSVGPPEVREDKPTENNVLEKSSFNAQEVLFIDNGKNESSEIIPTTITSTGDEALIEADTIPNKLLPASDSVNKQKVKKQSDESQSKRKKKQQRALYAIVMPTFGYQQVKPVDNDGVVVESIDKISAFSTKRLGIRAEVGYEINLSEKFSVNFGAFYLHRKQTIGYRYTDERLIEVVPVNSDGLSYAIVNPTQSSEINYDLKNLGIVAGANYLISSKRFSQKLTFSMELQKPLAASSEINIGEGPYIFANIAYRISYPVHHRADLAFQPTFNYAFQVDERINAPFYIKPYGLGLNFGVWFKM